MAPCEEEDWVLTQQKSPGSPDFSGGKSEREKEAASS